MDKQQRIEEVGKYIEKYYIPGYDDIVVDDEEVKGFFDKITEFLSGKKEREKDSTPAIEAPKEQESVSESSVPPEFDITTAKKRKISRPMSEMTVSNRKIDDLMSQMDETFSQRLRHIAHADKTEFIHCDNLLYIAGCFTVRYNSYNYIINKSF